jgi:chromosome partitioning protein
MAIMVYVIAVGNLKGGVGKSTIAVNLACELASKRAKVALVDADAQGTTAHYAGFGLLPVDSEHYPVEDSKVDRWIRHVLAKQTDYLVIDAPPHVGAVTQAIIGISDLALVPCTPSSADLVATLPTIELIRKVRSARADKGPKCLLIPSRVDRRTIAGREIDKALESFEEPVGPAIHQRTAFIDAFSAGRWIGDYAPDSDAHADIQALAKRVKQR